MLVRELIEKLAKCNPAATVLVDCDSGPWTPEEVVPQKAERHTYHDWDAPAISDVVYYLGEMNMLVSETTKIEKLEAVVLS